MTVTEPRTATRLGASMVRLLEGFCPDRRHGHLTPATVEGQQVGRCEACRVWWQADLARGLIVLFVRLRTAGFLPVPYLPELFDQPTPGVAAFVDEVHEVTART